MFSQSGCVRRLILSKSFVKRYSVTDRLLGSGHYGKVYLATEVATRRQLACKVVNLRAAAAAVSNDNLADASAERTTGGKRGRLMREVEILTMLNHVCQLPPDPGQRLIIVAEHCEHEKGISLGE